MKTKLEYRIGDWVCSEFTVSFDYGNDNNRRVAKKKVSIWGQIVGGKHRCLGVYNGACRDADFYDSEPAGFQITSKVFVYLVREGFLNKPVEVLPIDLKRAMGNSDGIVKFKVRQPPYTKEERRELSIAAKSQPRDSNGNFVKQTPKT